MVCLSEQKPGASSPRLLFCQRPMGHALPVLKCPGASPGPRSIETNRKPKVRPGPGGSYTHVRASHPAEATCALPPTGLLPVRTSRLHLKGEGRSNAPFALCRNTLGGCGGQKAPFVNVSRCPLCLICPYLIDLCVARYLTRCHYVPRC